MTQRLKYEHLPSFFWPISRALLRLRLPPPTNANSLPLKSILGWYEHTVAVALSRGDLSAFHSERRGAAPGSSGGSSSGGTKKLAPAPYRCPLCQVPGPFFLSVESAPAAHGSKSNPAPGKQGKPPKLKFKLLGARTVFGGAGPASGGVAVDEHAGGDGREEAGGEGGGYPRPSMDELRAAVRTQLALLAAAAGQAARTAGGVGRSSSGGVGGGGGGGGRSEGRTDGAAAAAAAAAAAGGRRGGENQHSEDRSTPPPGGGRREEEASRTRRRDRDRHRDREHGRETRGEEPETSRDNDVEFRERDSRGNGTGTGARHASGISDRRPPGGVSSGSGDHRTHSDRARDDRRRKRRKRRGRGEGTGHEGGDSGRRRSDTGSRRGGDGGSLPWSPGELGAEDGLAFIEAMLERERESLRRRSCPAS